MKVEIDAELCSGHGRCNTLAGDVFQLDEEGYNADRGVAIAVPSGKEVSARRGATSCPEAAISIIEG